MIASDLRRVFGETIRNHRTTRESVNVGVAYGSDVEVVTQLLEEAVTEHKKSYN